MSVRSGALADVTSEFPAEHPVLQRLDDWRVTPEVTVSAHGLARPRWRRIASANADQRLVIRNSLDVVIRADGTSIVAMMNEQERYADGLEIEVRQPLAHLVAVGHGRTQRDALNRVAQLGGKRRGGDRPAAGTHQVELGVRISSLEIDDQRADVRQVLRA